MRAFPIVDQEMVAATIMLSPTCCDFCGQGPTEHGSLGDIECPVLTMQKMPEGEPKQILAWYLHLDSRMDHLTVNEYESILGRLERGERPMDENGWELWCPICSRDLGEYDECDWTCECGWTWQTAYWYLIEIEHNLDDCAYYNHN